jgi:uroporphyrin-III C-methyltransferase
VQKGPSRRPRPRPRNGSLVVVGTGVAPVVQATLETVELITRADKLFYLVTDSLTEFWLKDLNASAETLADLYGEQVDRERTYAAMATRITSAVRRGASVCAAFYGHPGVFVEASHRAIEELQEDGYRARMVPAVSSDACLYADLGVDPGMCGVQSFEATDFLLRRRRFDSTSVLLLWQVGALGEKTAVRGSCKPERLATLTRHLLRSYPPRHPVVVYRAGQFPGQGPSIRSVRLETLPRTDVSPAETLYVPPLRQRQSDPRILKWLDGPARPIVRTRPAPGIRRSALLDAST